jgi:hypothetical protein
MLGVHHIIANVEAERLRSHCYPFRCGKLEPTRFSYRPPKRPDVVAALCLFPVPAKKPPPIAEAFPLQFYITTDLGKPPRVDSIPRIIPI